MSGAASARAAARTPPRTGARVGPFVVAAALPHTRRSGRAAVGNATQGAAVGRPDFSATLRVPLATRSSVPSDAPFRDPAVANGRPGPLRVAQSLPHQTAPTSP